MCQNEINEDISNDIYHQMSRHYSECRKKGGIRGRYFGDLRQKKVMLVSLCDNHEKNMI